MFLRVVFALSLIGLLATPALAVPENVQRYKAVDQLSDSIAHEYFLLTPEEQSAPAGQMLGVLQLSLRAESFRQLLAMSDDEALSVFPDDAPIREMLPAVRHQYFVDQYQLFMELTYQTVTIHRSRR